MQKYLYYVFFILMVSGCALRSYNNITLLNFIPNNAGVVFKINDFESLLSEINSNEIINQLKFSNPYNQITEKLFPLSLLDNQKEALIALSAIDSSSFDFTYITKDTISFKEHLLKDATKTTINSAVNDVEIHSYQLGNQLFFYGSLKGVSVICSSNALLKNIFKNHNKQHTQETLKSFTKISNTNKLLNIWIDYKESTALLPQLLYDDLDMIDDTLWMTLDLSLDNSAVILSGISVPDSSSSKAFNLLSRTAPVSSNLAHYAPEESNYLKRYSINDFKLFTQHPNQPIKSKDSLLYTVEEIGIAEIKNDQVLFLKTYGAAELLDYMNQAKTASKEIDGSITWTLQENSPLLKSIAPIIGRSNFMYVGLIENTFIFTATPEALERTLTNQRLGTTLTKSTLLKTINNIITDNASIQTVANLTGAVSLLSEGFSEKMATDLSKSKLKNYVFGNQYVADSGFYHTQYFIKANEKEVKANSVTPLFNLEFNTDLATLPQFVTNHTNRKKEIVVQDQDNVLYLISNSGKIIWKKQLNGTIQGKIKQVDLFKNGKLQLAFTTNNEFIILDRNGKEVSPFTFKYSGGNLNPLAVFDYEGNKDYRFVVTQNNKVFMYNKKGEIVKGFTYTNANDLINTEPKHFRIGSKDYIIFTLADGTLKIVSRTGTDRIKIDKKFSFSENAIYNYQNKFSFTTKNGYLNQVNTKGQISKTNLQLVTDHGIDATSRTLAVMNDNVLSIRGKKIALELGVYSKPQIFYLNDKIYVSVTDIQNQKIYLFDSQANAIPNFPMPGSSLIDMADVDNNKKPELVCKDQDNSIKIYTIQ